MLPGFDALGALKMLQESGLDIPFIVLTGAVSEGTVVECMKRGASDYLLKDRLTRLGPAVTRALQESALRRKQRESAAELKKCNDRFQQLVETTKVIPWELDLETWRFTYVGPQAEALLGHPIEDWYREGFWSANAHAEGEYLVVSKMPERAMARRWPSGRFELFGSAANPAIAALVSGISG